MSFTWFSALLILIILTAIGVGVLRGMRRGLIRSSISAVLMMISALIAGIIALPLSDLPTRLIYDVFVEETQLVDLYKDFLPSIDVLIRLTVDALLTPFVFVILFPFVHIIVSIIARPICRKIWKLYPNSAFSSPDPMSSPSYESQNAPFHARHDRSLGGIVGGLCALIAAIIVTSPLAGTLAMAGELNRNLSNQNIDWETIGIEDDFISELDPFLNDGSIALLNSFGGGFIYRATAASALPSGTNISLTDEVDAVSSFMPGMLNMLYSFEVNDLTPSTEELDQIVESIESSAVLKLVAVDIINAASQSWLRGELYLDIERPHCGNYFDMIITEILKVCAMSDENCVTADLRTLLNIYAILLENGVIGSELDQFQIEELLTREGFISRIKEELSKNPCMAGLIDKLSDTSLDIISSILGNTDLSSPEAQEFMQQICDQFNDIAGQPGFDISDQKDNMRDIVSDYADQLGVDLPADVAEMAIDSLIRRLDGQTSITPEELEKLFEEIRQNGTFSGSGFEIEPPDNWDYTFETTYPYPAFDE